MQARDILFTVLIAAVWGFNFLASKFAVVDFSPLLANAIRFLIVLVVLSPFLRLVPGRMIRLLSAAFLLGVVHFGLLFWAMKLAGGVGSVSIASQLNVPFSTILAVLILKETIGFWRVAGIAISFSGVMLLGFDPEIFAYWDALLVITVAAFVYAVSAILMRQLKDVPAVRVQAWVGVMGFGGSILLSILTESGQMDAVLNAETSSWLGVIYTAVFSSLIGHGGANYLFRKYEVSVVSPYFLILPLFSILAGVVVLDENVSWQMIVGGTITIGGVLLVSLRNKQKAKVLKGARPHGF